MALNQLDYLSPEKSLGPRAAEAIGGKPKAPRKRAAKVKEVAVPDDQEMEVLRTLTQKPEVTPEQKEEQKAAFEQQLAAALETGDEEALAPLIDQFEAMEKAEADEEAAGIGKPEFAENPNATYKRLLKEGNTPTNARQLAGFETKFNAPRVAAAQEFVDKERAALESTQEEKARYKRIYDIDAKGELPPAQVASFVKGLESTLGLKPGDLGHLLGAGSEEVTKLIADSIKDAKSVFGGRISDADLAAWFKRLPGLLQTSEGRIRAIGDLNTMAELKELKAQATHDIVKQYKGKIPLDIERRVDHKIKKERNKLIDMFEKGESNLPNYDKNLKKATKRTSRESTGGLLGGGLGALGLGGGGALGGALTGAALGSVGGPVGTVLGGLGGLAGGLGGAYAGGKAGYMGGSALGALAAEPVHQFQKWDKRVSSDILNPIRKLVGAEQR